MKLLRLVSLLLPCAIAHKNPAQHAGCLDSGLVQTLADGFGVLISNWSGAPDYSLYLANRIIHPDIEDYNESIKTLVTNGCATGPQPLYANRTEYEAGQLTVPPFPYERLTTWFSCETITFRWISAQKPLNVTGIIVLETVPRPREMAGDYARVIRKVYSEGNSGAWLVNRGVFRPTCAARR